MSDNKILYLFNLETNLESEVLAAGHAWIVEFSLYFDEVFVISTHVGKIDLPPNVRIIELGGGTVKNRLLALIKLSEVFLKITKNRKKSVAFHHMSSITAGLLGLPLRVIGVRQGFWYSHSKFPHLAKLGMLFVNDVFTTTQKSVPFFSNKVHFGRHGIDSKLFYNSGLVKRNLSIVSVGRITRIKKLEIVLDLISSSNVKHIPITFLGPVQNFEYKKELSNKAAKLNLDLKFIPPLKYSHMPDFYRSTSIIFSGTPTSIDKAIIEAAMCGCFVLSNNYDALEVTGMRMIWEKLNFNEIPEMDDQIQILIKLQSCLEISLRKELSLFAQNRNSLENLISNIVSVLENK
jgi:glycosyltransferase involved in cell wall biosynthesis